VTVKSERYFIRRRAMNSLSLIQAYMRLAFLITLCLYICVFNNFDACKYIGT
jgi:hypothetical protein